MTNTLEEFVFRFRWQIALLLIGLAFSAGGVFLVLQNRTPQFELVEESVATINKLVVEVSGAVKNPGVYELTNNARIEDAIKAAGGMSEDVNKEWVDKHLNRAAFVTDGQKIYIPLQSESPSASNQDGDTTVSNVLSSETEGHVNVNTASTSELEALNGIGPVYAKKIIDNRPYSSVEELIMKKVVTQKIYDANKDLFTVY